MSPVEVLAVVAIGFAAGVTGGAFGVGGGVLFVPGLVVIYGMSQLEAQATSLLAIIPVAAVGAWSQGRYGNLRLRDGLVIGVLSPLGVLAGTLLAEVLAERALQLLFAAMQLYFAFRLARRALTPEASAARSDRV